MGSFTIDLPSFSQIFYPLREVPSIRGLFYDPTHCCLVVMEISK